jgi:two-component system C4-dicarboxylate transport response regulator DctD
MTQLLLIDDEPMIRHSASQTLLLAGYEVLSFAEGANALTHLTQDFKGVVISDIRMPTMDGLEVLQHALHIDKDLPVILISGHADVATAVQAMRDGAYDLLEKPFTATQLLEVVKRALEKRRLTLENRSLKEELTSRERIGPRIIGQAPMIVNLRKMITRLAQVDADVLIWGETGTGKELVARSLHEQSKRRSHNYIAFNCATATPLLLDQELFGYYSVQNTKTRHIGKIEAANGGTLFLDEIEHLPLSTQATLLRVLQERYLEHVSWSKKIPLNIRLIASSQMDLKSAAEREEFKLELYYRLNVVSLEIPPLRARPDDIPLLFQHFVLVAAARCETEVPPLNHQAFEVLLSYDWPGNVRELRNIAERYVLLGENYGYDLAALMQSDSTLSGSSLAEKVASFEKTLIRQALNQFKGNIRQVTEQLNCPRKTLTDKMMKYGLDRSQFKGQLE